MDDFWYNKNEKTRNRYNFFNDTFPEFRSFESPFSSLHHSMQQMDRMMDLSMRNIFRGFDQGPSVPGFYPQPTSPSIDFVDRDLDNQVQKNGLSGVFDDANYTSEWDFVRKLDQLEKNPQSTLTNDKNANFFYGRTNFYTYNSSDGQVEERKVIEDTHGNRMESVQRKIGDRIWAKTMKRNSNGEIVDNEKLYNMQDQDKEKFVTDWKSISRQQYIPNDTHSFVKAIENEIPESKKSTEASSSTTKNENLTIPSLEQKSDRGWLSYLKFW